MLNIGFKEDAITMGMSTANMAYEVARHMGCSPIILVGNDLAFDSTGNTHAPGFILGKNSLSMPILTGSTCLGILSRL